MKFVVIRLLTNQADPGTGERPSASAPPVILADLAARWGGPLFSANVTGPLEQDRALVEDYRTRWVGYGRDPADALVGAFARRLGVEPAFASLEDAIARDSYFVGSPEQVVEQVHRNHAALGHEVQHVAGIGSPGDPVARAGIELFATEVLPGLQHGIPDRLW